MDLTQVMGLIVLLGASGFGGGILSLFVSLIVDAPWPAWAKDLTAFATCILVALLGCIVIGLDPTNLMLMIPAMIVGCHAAYVKVWKPTGIGLWIETFWSSGPRQ